MTDVLPPAATPADGDPEGGAARARAANGARSIVLEARGLTKRYVGGDGSTLTILDGVDLEVRAGEMLAVVGASGAGKSTFLHVLGALDTPTAGEVLIAGEPVSRQPEQKLAALRNRTVGFVFQFHHLLREFSALENVMLPLLVGGMARREAERRAAALLGRVGLAGRMHHRPAALSGGEQQRTAVARALVTEPAVLLADEPTGNLDHANGELIHDLLAGLVHELGLGMVVVTHNRSLAQRADRVLLLESGRLAETDVQQGVA